MNNFFVHYLHFQLAVQGLVSLYISEHLVNILTTASMNKAWNQVL
jgi:hypothetical protein